MKKTKKNRLLFKKKKQKHEEEIYKDLVYLERLALSMGFLHQDILLFDNLTTLQTKQALVVG